MTTPDDAVAFDGMVFAYIMTSHEIENTPVVVPLLKDMIKLTLANGDTFADIGGKMNHMVKTEAYRITPNGFDACTLASLRKKNKVVFISDPQSDLPSSSSSSASRPVADNGKGKGAGSGQSDDEFM